MNIKIYSASGSAITFSCYINGFKSIPYKKIDYIELISKKTKAFDYGPTFDKYYSEFTIVAEKSIASILSFYLSESGGQYEIETEGDEYIFGAGIDYTYPFSCNVTSSSIACSQNDHRFTEIKMKVEAIGYLDSGVKPIFYRASVPSGLPSLNYQTPIKRIINNNKKHYNLLEFGESGMITELDSSDSSSKNYILEIPFAQTFEEAARIEKYFFEQRATPFFIPDLDFVNLFLGQSSEKVMITGITTSRVAFNDWRVSLKLITNV